MDSKWTVSRSLPLWQCVFDSFIQICVDATLFHIHFQCHPTDYHATLTTITDTLDYHCFNLLLQLSFHLCTAPNIINFNCFSISCSAFKKISFRCFTVTATRIVIYIIEWKQFYSYQKGFDVISEALTFVTDTWIAVTLLLSFILTVTPTDYDCKSL